MQPDAWGIAFGTAVLAAVIAVFGLLDWLISGAVSRISYSFGATVSRGLAAWSGRAREARSSSSPSG